MEKQFEVKPVLVKQYCDDCPDTELESDGMAYLTSPAQYLHFCPKCKKRYTFYKIYPFIDYQERTP